MADNKTSGFEPIGDEPGHQISVQDEREFKRELAGVLNKYRRENLSDTPDFALADYLIACLGAYENAVYARDGGRPARCNAMRITDRCEKALGHPGPHRGSEGLDWDDSANPSSPAAPPPQGQ